MNTTIINEESYTNNKETHNKHDLQKSHQNDKVVTEQILDTYVVHNLLERICKLF